MQEDMRPEPRCVEATPIGPDARGLAPAGYEAIRHTALARAMAGGATIALSRRGFAGALLAACCACAFPLLAGCSSDSGEASSDSSEQASGVTGSVTADEDVQSITLFLFDTVIEIQAACTAELMDSVAERMQYFENKFSRTVEGSDIWNVNEAGGAPVQVCEETADIISRALEYARESDGLFDVSIGAVSSLWDFVEGVRPADSAISEAVQHVDYRNVQVDGTTVTLLDPEAKLDLGGIAKGYITDDVVSMLREGGCKDAFLNLGGNVYVMGNSFDGDAWVVGVQDPNGSLNTGIAKISCSDASVVTSGLYERSFEEDGTLYYHILDPKTGYPVKTDLESASICCESSTLGDAYSTILFLKGHDAALELIESDERFQGGVLVDDSGTATISEGSAFELLED